MPSGQNLRVTTGPSRDAALLVFLLACAFLLLSRIILKFPSHFDEGISLYDAVRIMAGQVPYRDFFHNTTPGAAALLALVFNITGISMLPARLVIVFFGLALMIVLYVLGKRLTRNPLLAALPPVFFFLLDLFPNGDYTTHRPAMFFAVLALASTTIVQGKIGPALAGACGGVSFLMNQNIGVYALIGTGLLALFKQWFFHEHLHMRRVAKHLTSVALGTLLAVLPVLIILGHYGALGEFFYDTIIWPMTWYRGFNRYPYFSFEISLVQGNLRQIAQGSFGAVNFGEIGLYLFTGFLPLVVYPAFLVSSFFKREWGEFTLCIMGICLLLSSSNHPDQLHIVRSLSPFFLLVVLLLSTLGKEVRRGQRLALAPFALAVLLSAFALLDEVLFMLSPRGTPSFPVATPRGTLYAPTEIEARVNQDVIRFVLSMTGPEDEVFIYHWSPELYFLFGRNNPTMFDTYKPLYTSPDQLKDLKRQLQRSRPRLIVKDNYVASFSDPRGRTHATFPFVDPGQLVREDPVDRWISRAYRLTGTINIYRFLEPVPGELKKADESSRTKTR